MDGLTVTATVAEAVVAPGVVGLAPSEAVMLRLGVPDMTAVEEQL